MGATREEILNLADFWESRGDQAEADRLRRSADEQEVPYDVEEMSVLARMKKIMKEKHGYDDEDFEDCTFADIESMFLDSCGEEDFR